jgi:hypothetical protein
MSPGRKIFLFALPLLVGMSVLTRPVAAQGQSKGPRATAPVPSISQLTADEIRIEGEKRFQANCGRCHQSPHKFPPRMMATIVRHMRVRATITDEDMRLVLLYMTQ